MINPKFTEEYNEHKIVLHTHTWDKRHSNLLGVDDLICLNCGLKCFIEVAGINIGQFFFLRREEEILNLTCDEILMKNIL